MIISKLFKNSFFYRSSPVAAFGYSNQSKIFPEISASKFQGQHAAQLGYVDALQLKPKSPTGVFCEILEQLLLRII